MDNTIKNALNHIADSGIGGEIRHESTGVYRLSFDTEKLAASFVAYADQSCAAKDAEIAELKRRVEELEVELSESMEIKITRLIAEKGKYEMNLEHPMLIAFIGCLIDCYRVFGGKNYLSIRCVYENELYECVIARIEGKTPAELVDELKIELAEAKRRIADLESHLSSYVNTTNPIIPR